MKTKPWLLPILTLAVAGMAAAQTADPARFYKLEFVFKELEGGKAISTRSFVTMLAPQTPGRDTPAANIRASGKMPITNGNSLNYYDVNVNIDARDLREAQSDLTVALGVEVNTSPQDTPPAISSFRQNRWNGIVLVPIRKPTVVFASDDLTSKRQFQLELTATPIK